jgi:fluoroacetyl-CoA thioesterase
MLPLPIGSQAVHQHVVRSADTATQWGNELPVLATPVLLWLAEITTMRVLETALEDGEMTVGYKHADAQHLAATPADWTVTLQATLVAADGKLLTFEIEGRDASDVVYRGTHVRAVVDRNRFLERFGKKTAAGEVARIPA